MTDRSFQELMEAFMAICPQGEMGEDLDGQIVFYTGLMETKQGNVVPYEDEEER